MFLVPVTAVGVTLARTGGGGLQPSWYLVPFRATLSGVAVSMPAAHSEEHFTYILKKKTGTL